MATNNDALNSFLNDLDDKNLEAFTARGPAGLDDDHLQKLNDLLSPQPQQSFIQRELSPGTKLDPHDISGSVSYLGVEANKYLQKKAADLAEAGGKQAAINGEGGNPSVLAATGLSTASQFLMPQNRLAAQLYGIQALTPFLGALSKATGLSPALNDIASSVASKLYQYTGIPATKATLLAKNLEKVANPDDIGALNSSYGVSANTLGIGKLADQLPDEPGAFKQAVGMYAGKEGAQLVNDPINASYQDLHNVVESVSAKLDAPWAYPGTENMRTLPAQQMQELIDLKQRAQWGMLAKAMHEVGTDVPGSADKLDAVENIVDLRHDLATAQSATSVGWTPSNLNGSQNALRTMYGVGAMGAAATTALAGHPIAAIPVAASALAGSPMLMNSAILNARAGLHFLPYAPGVAAMADNSYQPGSEVQKLLDQVSGATPNAQ